MELKGRIVVNGNRDADTDDVRSDCAEADMAVIRLLLSIGTCLEFTFPAVDIKMEHMQSVPITREVFFRPTR